MAISRCIAIHTFFAMLPCIGWIEALKQSLDIFGARLTPYPSPLRQEKECPVLDLLDKSLRENYPTKKAIEKHSRCKRYRKSGSSSILVIQVLQSYEHISRIRSQC